ncbi:MAG TPA: NAD(P)-binding domain-containing protein, partial [Casimicrobiaceae bacterium]|nr:NAD(P)-binding domain-containing protein [Casimicrobiaceae bacterium]
MPAPACSSRSRSSAVARRRRSTNPSRSISATHRQPSEEDMEKPRIGFVGIGLMGHGIAKNLVSKGYPLTLRVHRNREAARDLLALGAKEVATNAEVARASDIVFLCVTGAPQVEEVVFGPEGLASAARPGMTIVDTSTSELGTTTRMRDALAAKQVRFIDAPLARTPVEAEAGRLNIMV